MRQIRQMVINGDFDRYMLRPMNVFFQIIAERLQPDALGELLAGCILVIRAGMQGVVQWNAERPVFAVCLRFGTVCKVPHRHLHQRDTIHHHMGDCQIATDHGGCTLCDHRFQQYRSGLEPILLHDASVFAGPVLTAIETIPVKGWIAIGLLFALALIAFAVDTFRKAEVKF